MKIATPFKLFWLVFIAGMIIIATSCKNDTTTALETTQLSGALVDVGGLGIPNAIIEAVWIENAKVKVVDDKIIERDTTDEDGNFSFKALPSDYSKIDFRIIHPDLKPYQENLNKILSTQSDKKHVRISMLNSDTCCGKIEITVKGSGGTVLSGVEVRLNRGSELKRRTTTNSDGVVLFQEICNNNNYWVRLSKTGYNVKEADGIHVTNCDTVVKLTYEMVAAESDSCCNGVLTIRPVDKNSQELLNGSVVKLRKDGTELSRYTVEGNNIVFRGLCRGRYSVLVQREGYTAQEYNVEFACNDTVERKIDMERVTCCDGVFKIFVKDSLGNALTDVVVNLWKGSTKLGAYSTGADGSVTLRGICQGDYSFSFIKTGYKSAEMSQSIGCDDTLTINKTLYRQLSDSCCNGLIKVYVKDSKTAESLNGANVKLFQDGKQLRSETVKEGFAIFKNICKGNYSVLIGKDLYKSMDFSIVMGCNDTVDYNKTLVMNDQDTCCNGTAKLIVTDAQGNRLANATVNLWLGNTKLATATTNGDGVVTFTKLCKGTYQFSIIRGDYKGMEFSFELECNGTFEATKVLERTATDTCCNGSAKIIVKDAQGNRLVNAAVTLWKGGVKLGTYQTNADGYVLFTKLCTGTYGINIGKDGYKGMEFSFTMECNKELEFTKSITSNQSDSCCKGVLTVRVDNESGTALADAIVNLIQSGTVVKTGMTNPFGSVTITGICKGTYSLQVKRTDYFTKSWDFAIGCNDTMSIVKVLKDTCCSGILRLKILDNSDSTAINEAEVSIYANNSLVATGYSNGEGWFTQNNLCSPLTYTVIIRKYGYTDRTVTFTYYECGTKTETIRL